MTIIDRIILWILTSLGINTEADAAEPTINWLVDLEEGFETVLKALQGPNGQQGWALVSTYYMRDAIPHPSSPLRFAMADIVFLPKPCAEVGEFTVGYAYYNRGLGVLVSPKRETTWKGVFYQVLTGDEIVSARRVRRAGESWHENLRAACEDAVRAALVHLPRITQYMELLSELGYADAQGMSIGQEGSACTFYAGHDDKIVGPEVVLHKGSDEVSYSAWAIRFVPVIGPWLYIADFHGDYRQEIRAFFAAQPRDAA